MTLTPRRRTVSGHGLGYVRDLPDHRDLLFRPKAERLPAEVRLDQSDAGDFAVYDQGQLGSCTGNGIAAAVEFDVRVQGLRSFTPSRLFIYYEERLIEGTVGEDAGAMIRDGVKVVNKIGVPSERSWPYKIERFTDAPSAAAMRNAAKAKITKYERVAVGSSGYMRALAAGRPVVFGISLYESFEGDLGPDAMVPVPSPGEALLGGHCMVIMGYQSIADKIYFRVRNSWGKDWGDGGYCWMPSSYISGPAAGDAWTLTTLN